MVTIHQPSAQLFARFDKLLLLASGGKTVYFGDIVPNASTIKDYLGKHGSHCPPQANPAEYMIDLVTGHGTFPAQDWNQTWLRSAEHEKLGNELDEMIEHAAAQLVGHNDDDHEFAASMWTQAKLVTQRMNISLFRNTDYLNSKLAMHISLGFLNDFTFWMIGDSLNDLQQNLFTIAISSS